MIVVFGDRRQSGASGQGDPPHLDGADPAAFQTVLQIADGKHCLPAGDLNKAEENTRLCPVAAGPVTRLTHERFAHSALAREAWIGTRRTNRSNPSTQTHYRGGKPTFSRTHRIHSPGSGR